MKKRYAKKRAPRRTLRWPKAKTAFARKKKKQAYRRRQPLVSKIKYSKEKYTNLIPILMSGGNNTDCTYTFNRFTNTRFSGIAPNLSVQAYGYDYGGTADEITADFKNARWKSDMKDHQEFAVRALSISYMPATTGRAPIEVLGNDIGQPDGLARDANLKPIETFNTIDSFNVASIDER